MLKNILLSEYKDMLKSIIKGYKDFLSKNNGYYNYLKIINYEIEAIKSAFNTLIIQKKNIFKSIFENDFESILYAIDKQLFDMIKSIFENVSLLLNK